MKALSYIINFSILFGVIGSLMYSCERSIARQEQYAIEHNCRWDYNDMCYTIDERPWLFNS